MELIMKIKVPKKKLVRLESFMKQILQTVPESAISRKLRVKK